MIDDLTLQVMHKYGGSFARKLAELYYLADRTNKLKLEECFKEIFDRYREFAKKIIERERSI